MKKIMISTNHEWINELQYLTIHKQYVFSNVAMSNKVVSKQKEFVYM